MLTDADGNFEFTGEFAGVFADGQETLLGYTLELDASETDTGVGGLPLTWLQMQSPEQDALNSKAHAAVDGVVSIGWVEQDRKKPVAKMDKRTLDGKFLLALPALSDASEGYVTDPAYEVDGFDTSRGEDELRMHAGFLEPDIDPQGSLEGVLWLDANDNGVRDDDEEPLTDYKVTLDRLVYDPESGEWLDDASWDDEVCPAGSETDESKRGLCWALTGQKSATETGLQDGGWYRFSGLSASIRDDQGVRHLVGYRVSLAGALPRATGYHVTGAHPRKSSDYDSKHANGSLVLWERNVYRAPMSEEEADEIGSGDAGDAGDTGWHEPQGIGFTDAGALGFAYVNSFTLADSNALGLGNTNANANIGNAITGNTANTDASDSADASDDSDSAAADAVIAVARLQGITLIAPPAVPNAQQTVQVEGVAFDLYSALSGVQRGGDAGIMLEDTSSRRGEYGHLPLTGVGVLAIAVALLVMIAAGLAVLHTRHYRPFAQRPPRR